MNPSIGPQAADTDSFPPVIIFIVIGCITAAGALLMLLSLIIFAIFKHKNSQACTVASSQEMSLNFKNSDETNLSLKHSTPVPRLPVNKFNIRPLVSDPADYAKRTIAISKYQDYGHYSTANYATTILRFGPSSPEHEYEVPHIV